MKKKLSIILAFILTLTVGATPAFASGNNVLEISKKSESYKISDKLYGSFIEDISYACDGGLVSNLVNNDSFEYKFNNTTAWVADGLTLGTGTEKPLNKNNPTYAEISVNGKGTLKNTGYTEMYKYKSYDRDEKKAKQSDMGFKKGGEYEFGCYIKNENFKGDVNVYLDSKSNKNNIVSLDISKTDGIWTKLTATLKSNADEDGALAIEFNGKGKIDIDFVTLVPKSSYGYGTKEWKYVTLRDDLYTALKQLSPKFVRFPGGCLAEGDSLANLYDWKETIGPLEERVQFYNLWRDDEGRDYINTNAMGYHEYFQLCADLNAEPLPILNVGLTCQGRADYDAYVNALRKLNMTDEEWEKLLTDEIHIDPDDEENRKGYTEHIESLNIKSQADFDKYLDTIALKPGTKEWDAYVQDILDLIEYANGGATTTYWGALRAANGSAKPFNLKYIGLGNENWGEIYKRNFEALYKEVKKAYPDITVISSSGTYLEGDAYDYNWSWINKDYADTVVDEHYYTNDGYLFDHNDRYDNFDRNGAHVFIGEYAATSSGIGTIQTKSNMNEAVEEASYLTGIERNSDIVDMASYAPTFAKVNAQCWNVNLIWFNSQEVVLTPSYYVQMLFSNNYGNEYIKSNFDNGKTVKDGLYESVTVDRESETLFVKLVNTTGKKQSVDVKLSDFGNINKVSAQSVKGSYKAACNEIGSLTTYPSEYDLTNSENISVDMDKYDVTVLRIAYGNNDGASFYSLPDNINTMTTSVKKYTPPAVKIAIPCAVGGAAVIIFAGIVITKTVKKKKND